jgi:Flp pilus assembly protein TadD
MVSLSAYGDKKSSLQDVPAVEFFPDTELVVQGQNFYRHGAYGKAQVVLQKAVEVYPKDAAAWLGLAASYDRLGRFDQADVAYRQVASLIGKSAVYYNNVGYSQMLRGDLVQARRLFLAAYELDPGNPTTINNIELLDSSVRQSRRG